MGNISSIYGYTKEKLYEYLLFFGKNIVVKTDFNTFIFEKTHFEEGVNILYESIKNKSFTYLEIQTYKDIGGETIFFDKTMNFDNFDSILHKFRINDYEKEFKFFHDKNRIMLSFSLISLLEDDEMDRLQLVLMGLRDMWVREGRLNAITGVGAFGIII
jgi:hypothetical protein